MALFVSDKGRAMVETRSPFSNAVLGQMIGRAEVAVPSLAI